MSKSSKIAQLKALLLEIDLQEPNMLIRVKVSQCLALCDEITDYDVDETTKNGAILTKARVYIIDDDEDTLNMLKFVLKKNSFEVYAESSPLLALEALDRIQPDIIMLDLMMPDMSGLEFLQRIKDHPQRNKFKVVVGSSRNYDKDRISVLKAGANEFISKPYNISELAIRLHKLTS